MILNRLAKILAVLLVMAVFSAVLVAAVVPALLALRDDGLDGTALVDDAAFPVGLEPGGNGAFLYGERETGHIRLVRRNGQLARDPLGTVDVVADGQRGLLGLARYPDGRLFAAWTRPEDNRLVVGEVGAGRAGEPRLVWVGPETAERGNGGHLEISPLGDLVIGIGDAGEPELIREPDAPNGKLLVLDPDRGVRQTPEVLSSGWRNPFAFTFDEDGRLWVADNAPSGSPERIGLGDKEDGELIELTEVLAPSALIVLPDGDLGLCGYLEGQMRVVAIDRGGGPGTDPTAELTNDVVVEPCTVGAATLFDGTVVFASEERIRAEEP